MAATQSLLVVIAESVLGMLDQDISFDQALVLENVVIDVALALDDAEQRSNFIAACIGEHPACSSRWAEVASRCRMCGAAIVRDGAGWRHMPPWGEHEEPVEEALDAPR